MDDKNYQELVRFIGEKFERVSNTSIELNNKIDNLDKKFELKFEELKSDFHHLQSAVDAHATKSDTFFLEMTSLNSRVDRHERWINQTAEKVGIKLQS